MPFRAGDESCLCLSVEQSQKIPLASLEEFLIAREKGWRILIVSMGKTEYWTGAHTTHRLQVHIVMIPKYRKRVLRGEIVETVKTLFYEAAEVNGWNIEEFAIEPDHIHMLLQYKPNKSISEILQILKG